MRAQPVSLRSFAWRGFLATLMLATTGPAAGAAGLLRVGGGTSSSSSTAPANSAVTAAQAAALAQRAQASLLRSNTVQQSLQAMQAAARAAAQAATSSVPDGLGVGGLQVATGVPADLSNVLPAENATLWQGAQLPTETSSGGKVDVNIKQTAQQALLTWQTFNIGKNTTLTYDQSAGGSNTSQWVVFNKINDPSGNPSQILGSIKATGQVYVINQNGIIFGGASQVNTHTLVASALPINDNLVSRGLLNNPDAQFLFSALSLPAGSTGPTPAFIAPMANTGDGHSGDVVIQAGAQITSPTNADHVGGRIALIGANVTNDGTLSTPDGQAILAAGLQVGFQAHSITDASLRGLDVYVGAVADPASSDLVYAGTATNSGVIEAPRSDVTIVGKNVNQLGVINSSTSTALNGRIDLLAEYDAESSAGRTSANLFLSHDTGLVTFGGSSATLILPELDTTSRVVGTQLSLPSQINVRGLGIYLEDQATVFAPSAQVQFDAGRWETLESNSLRLAGIFAHTAGQIYLGNNALIDVAGSSGVSANVSENFVAVQLRGSELADAPLQRDGALRGQTVLIDLRQIGVFNGKAWVGTPVADASGYVNLADHTVGELTISGGSVNLTAGEAVVINSGATVDVSGGWIDYQGGQVSTSKVMSGGHIYDISQATPDRVYSGLYTGVNTAYEAGYIQGGSAGGISIKAASMSLDGGLRGGSVAGPRQISRSDVLATTFAGSTVLATVQSTLAAPALGKLSLTFTSEHQDPTTPNPQYVPYSPTPPIIRLQANGTLPAPEAFGVDSSGVPLSLSTPRKAEIDLSPSLFSDQGFGSFTINNSDGDVFIPAGTSLKLAAGASLDILAGNLSIDGSIYAPGGKLGFTVYDFSPTSSLYSNTTGSSVTPAADPARGLFSLGAGSILSTAGLVVDERVGGRDVSSQFTKGGSILIDAYDATLVDGSRLDVSGGGSVSASGKVSYRNGGGIDVRGGRDPKLNSLIGGRLDLGAGYISGTGFSGFSGATGGQLSLLAPRIRVSDDSTAANEDLLVVAPDFFNQGGFGSFTLKGRGTATGDPGIYLPGFEIAGQTRISPTAQGLLANVTRQGFTLERIVNPGTIPQTQRTPVSVSFSASGLREYFDQNILIVRGDLVMGSGAVIKTDPKASVSLSGDTVSVKGSVYAPAGQIVITGGGNSNLLFNSPDQALPTVEIDSASVLSVAGTTLAQFTPNANGTRMGSSVLGSKQTAGYLIGDVLNGGTISVAGNIVAKSGAVLDVSGATDVLDKLPAYTSLDATGMGLLSSRPVATRIDSNGGTITLTGKQELFTDATLKGAAGGSKATGGSLVVSSERFVPAGSSIVPSSLDIRLTVTQNTPAFVAAQDVFTIGKSVLDTNGNALAGQGYLTADALQAGGFDRLTLKGTVEFSGDVTLSAGQSLTLSDNGVLYAGGQVHLMAPYVQLGTALQPPQQQQGVSPFIAPPTHGGGVLSVDANLIDFGYLSLQNVGLAQFHADGGDIRGDGVLDVAGRIELRAGQIYPPTATTFTISAHDYSLNGSISEGAVAIIGSGERQTPYSAGGQLNVYASIIEQGGVLRAPLGGIDLGWNGTGTAPVDLLTGQAVASTGQLTLGAASKTSVSAIDPLTDKGLVIPFGLSSDGKTWIDPSGLDITVSGVAAKTVNVSAKNVNDQKGAVIDIRGGGDLYAYQWVSGVGGTQDVLASNKSFAIIPAYQADYAPLATFGSGSKLNGEAGYLNATLAVGDQVYLDASNGLSAGYYTLLPARYALLPGAYLVTPQSGTPVAKAVANPDGSYVVSGFRANGLSKTQSDQPLFGSFEVASESVVSKRAQYEDFYANTFLRQSALDHDATPARLPVDSGQLVLTAPAGGSMNLKGTVLSQALDPKGRGGLVDISSPVDIVIAGAEATAAPEVLVLNAADLTNFGADSLLIGGIRDASGTKVAVTTNHMLVDNSGAGSQLKGSEIILVANQSLVFADGAAIEQTGNPAAYETLYFGNAGQLGSGDGVLLRMTGDESAKIIRSGVSSSTAPSLVIGVGVHISGLNLTLDSTYGTSLDASAILSGNAVSLNSGQISLLLDGAGTVGSTSGLVLTGASLANIQSGTNALSLLSYSSIDIYGHGQVGVFGVDGRPEIASLELHAAALRGFNADGGQTTFAARSILIDNEAGRTAPTTMSSSSGTLMFQAETLQLGANNVAVNQYDSLEMQASDGVFISGTGVLIQQGTLSIKTPLITAATASSYDFTASDSVNLLASTGATESTLTGGLGARVSFAGASINDQTKISLPSGQIALHATTGDVVIGGVIDVSGTVRHFYDLDKFTGGGLIQTISDTGSVNVTSSASLLLAAQAGAGNAGTLSVNAPAGSLSLNGVLTGQGGTGGYGGIFFLDVGSLSSLGTLDARLNADGFMQSRSIRVRSGDVLLDGLAASHIYNLSTDTGAITMTGRIDATGETGGQVVLAANRGVTLAFGSEITVAAQKFDSAGKGGTISIETRGDGGSVIDLQPGATLDLSVAANTPTSAADGKFTGQLHLRAPQNAIQTDLSINPLASDIIGASAILVEGYRVFTPAGGLIDGVEAAVSQNANRFTANTGDISTTGTMMNRLFSTNQSLVPVVSVIPGAEIANANTTLTLLGVKLNTSGSSGLTVAAGVPLTFPAGTLGNNKIKATAAGTLSAADGTVTKTTANAIFAVPAGSVLTLASSGTVSFSSGSGGGGAVIVPAQSGFTSVGSTTLTPSGPGGAVQLTTSGSSSLTFLAGATLALPSGTPGNNKITSTVGGVITLPDGTVGTLIANTPTVITPGSAINFTLGGTLAFASGGAGGPIPVVLPIAGTITLAGAATVSTSTNALTLNKTWDLSTYRFGLQNVPGVLTLRAAGDLVFNFGASLSDGFAPTANTTTALWQAPLMTAGSRSWSYRLVSGADFQSADYRSVLQLSTLPTGAGSVLLGKGAPALPTATASATSQSIIPTYYQVIRTGTGDIDIVSGRDVQLLNSLATIYTAGTQAAKLADFDVPILDLVGNNANGVFESPAARAQYSFGGGNVDIVAQNDIAHYRTSTGGALVDDSAKQMPTNWLYRRGATNSAGEFDVSSSGDIASTTWWVDFSNFFEGVGALGGGNVALTAGRNITNVDAVVPTNARMTYQAVVTTGAGVVTDKLAANQTLHELGGGDLLVQAGNNINAGVYYVERGSGLLSADSSILTNRTRAALTQATLTNSAFANVAPDASTWLATTLFVGKGTFTVEAGNDLLLGSVANVFLLPQGINNRSYQRSYFSTYDASTAVDVSSLTGTVTLRDNPTSSDGFGSGSLISWYLNVLYPSTVSSAVSLAASQPWLKILEKSISKQLALQPFQTVAALMPPTLRATAFSSDINVVGGLLLSPSSTGTLELSAAGSINGFTSTKLSNPTRPFDPTTNTYTFSAGLINLSDADPSAIASITSPLTTREILTPQNLTDSINALFSESGATTGTNAILQNKLKLHAAIPLHANDYSPVRVYAVNGDVSGVNLFAGKASQVIAGQDITDISLYLQNMRATDITLVQAGRDIVAYAPTSLLREQANTVVIQAANNNLPSALSGDIQIGGLGTLEVFAGRNLNLGGGPNNADGTGIGITSIGNLRNPALPFSGASIVAGAGLGSANGLESAAIDFSAFSHYFMDPDTSSSEVADYLAKFLDAGADVGAFKQQVAAGQPLSSRYLPILGTLMGDAGATNDQIWDNFTHKSQAEQNRLAVGVFYTVLRDAGRDHNDYLTQPTPSGYKNYSAGFGAVAALFSGDASAGDILTDSRLIKTTRGGDVSLLAPGGSVKLGSNNAGNSAINNGILTEYGGNISIFVHSDVDVGTSRIFTLRGGNEIIWASTGNIAAGISSKTIQSAPPTRVLIDPQSGDVQNDLAGLSTGGGIGVLDTVAGVMPGDIDLIAPIGTIDAGDAGIRSSGNLNIAALQVLNASNIQTGGTSTGTPAASAAPVSAPSSTTTSESANSASGLAQSSRDQNRNGGNGDNVMPSLISVEVLGYGGSDPSTPGSDQNKDDKDKKDEAKADEGSSPKQLTKQDSSLEGYITAMQVHGSTKG